MATTRSLRWGVFAVGSFARRCASPRLVLVEAARKDAAVVILLTTHEGGHLRRRSFQVRRRPRGWALGGTRRGALLSYEAYTFRTASHRSYVATTFFLTALAPPLFVPGTLFLAVLIALFVFSHVHNILTRNTHDKFINHKVETNCL